MTISTLAEREALARLALEVAREAAAFAAQGFRRPKRVDHKGEKDLVTEFDTATEDLIRERFAKATPEIAIVAEEGGGRSGSTTWLVDPIDGTTNYSRGHPFWCVSIALVVEERCEVGVVVAPALRLAWTAFRGGGASRDDGHSAARCSVSGTRDLADAFLATGFPYDRRTNPQNNFAEFMALKRKALGIRRCGSAALDLCFVADGTYDGYWEQRLKAWDVAAGVCLVMEAGGTVSDFGGAPFDLSVGRVVATNGAIHDALVQSIAEASPPCAI